VDYYLQTKDGQQAGPYSLDQLRVFWRNGQITMDTPCWSQGMGWKSIRALENSLTAPSRPGSLPPIPRNSTTASRLGRGCTFGCLGLVILFGAFIGFLSLLPPDKDANKPKVETSWDKGLDSGMKLGYACGLEDYNEGKMKESPEQLDASARKISDEYTDAEYRRGFIRGVPAGYELGWERGERGGG